MIRNRCLFRGVLLGHGAVGCCSVRTAKIKDQLEVFFFDGVLEARDGF